MFQNRHKNMKISENQTPERLRGSRSKILRKIGRFGINISGWTIKGKIPDEERIVLIAAPHTSNWDFILAMLAIFGLNIECLPNHLTLIFNPKIASIAKIKSQLDV